MQFPFSKIGFKQRTFGGGGAGGSGSGSGGGNNNNSSNNNSSNNNRPAPAPRTTAQVQADINRTLKETGGTWNSDLNKLVAERTASQAAPSPAPSNRVASGPAPSNNNNSNNNVTVASSDPRTAFELLAQSQNAGTFAPPSGDDSLASLLTPTRLAPGAGPATASRTAAQVQAEINAALKDSGGEWTSGLNKLVAERTALSGASPAAASNITVSTSDASNPAAPPKTTTTLTTEQLAANSDGKYGYYRVDTGEYVPPGIDKENGGGPDYGGVSFGSGGGAELDLDADQYISEAEMASGRTPENPNGLTQNLWSNISNGIKATPLGSGINPTGIAGYFDRAPFGLGLVNAARTASPPSYIRPDSSLPAQSDPAYANLNLWWEGDQYQSPTTATNTGPAPRATAAESILNNNNDGTGGGTRPADGTTSGGPGRAPAPEGYMYDANGVLIPIPVQSGQPINSNLSYQPGQTTVATMNNYANPFTAALPVSQSDAFTPPSLAQIQGVPSPYAQQQTAFEQMQQPPVLFPNSLV